MPLLGGWENAAVQHAPIKTFHPRRSRIAVTAAEALDRLLASHEVDLGTGQGLRAARPLLLEIGSGMGESALQWAQANPDATVLAIDVHTPGVGRLLRDAEQLGLPNVQVAIGDAVPFISGVLPEAAVRDVRILYPDPWPKAKHHKRRLIQPPFLSALARVMADGGSLHVATDWPDYAEQMREVLGQAADFEVIEESHERLGGRPQTGFERKALRAGRASTDFIARRSAR